MIDQPLPDNLSVNILPEWVVGCINGPPAPFESDSEYVQCLCAQVILRAHLRRTRDRFAGGVFSDPAREDRAAILVDNLERLANAADQRINLRLGVAEDHGWVPRLGRLAQRYGWTDRELLAFQYMVVQTLHCVKEILGGEIHDAMAASGMAAEELFRFVDLSRQHIREGLFEVDKGLSSSVFRADFKLHDEVIKALVGADLTTDDLLKLDGTTLFDVLVEEPGFSASRDSVGSQSSVGQPQWMEEPLGDRRGYGHEDERFDTGGREAGAAPEPEAELGSDPEQTIDEVASRLGPYISDSEYLEDHFRYIAARIRRIGEQMDDSHLPRLGDRSKESVLREMGAKERILRQICNVRVNLTLKKNEWLPRAEGLVASRGLDDFEKWVLLTLVGLRLSDDIKRAAETGGHKSADVGDLLTVWADSLEDQINRRKHFYRGGTLVREGLIRLDTRFGSDLQNQDVEIDRRMMDFIVGLDTETSEIVEGSHLYSPKVQLEQVILPRDQKQLVLDTIGSFGDFRRVRDEMGFADAMAYGRGLVMLFYGPSGTGKTMLANAIGNHLGKKIFLINFPTLGMMWADEVLAALFREARIHDAILFFDECEGLFESREKGNAGISTLLTEIERHDGPVIMATNRPFDLDEAMNRRITLAIEFRMPDPHLRADIWRVHLPAQARLGDDVDVDDLARKYELTGGFIKNSVKSALSFAVARDHATPVIFHDDLDHGARLQLRSRLRMVDLERRIVSNHGLDWLVVPDNVREVLREVVSFEKARKVLYGQWGFDRVDGRGQGVIAVFHGVPGTGKTQAAEGIAFEIGRPLRMINPAELLSKYVGETAKNIDALFTDLQNNDAVLLFEEAEGLFGSRSEAVTATDRFANVDTGLLLHHIERYPGLVILTTNMLEGIDPAFQRRMRYVVEFPAPSELEREHLWRQLLPTEVPRAVDVDFGTLASKFPLTGGGIKNAVYRAAARAALRDMDVRMVTMNDLLTAAAEELVRWERRRVGFCPALQ